MVFNKYFWLNEFIISGGKYRIFMLMWPQVMKVLQILLATVPGVWISEPTSWCHSGTPRGGGRGPQWQSSLTAPQLGPGHLQSSNTLRCLPVTTWDLQLSQISVSMLEGQSFGAQGQTHLSSCPFTKPASLDLLDYRLWPAWASQSRDSSCLANILALTITSLDQKDLWSPAWLPSLA